ncbi:hypothetical protein GCM10028816_10260 [Spirosoma lituiforme]
MNRTNMPLTELLQNVMMASPNGALVLQAIRGADGRLIDLYMTKINSVAEKELDCPAVEALGQSFAQAFPHLAEKHLLETYRQVLNTGKSAQFKVHYVRPGQSVPTGLDVSVVRREKSLLITYTQVADTKIEGPEESLLDTLQTAFDESVNGISVFKALRDEHGQVNDFRMTMINKAGLQMTGLRYDDLVGKTIWEVYPATSINGLYKQYVRAFETGQIITVEHYYPEYDIWRAGKIVPTAEGIIVTYNDTTPTKKAQEKVVQQAQLLDVVLEQIPTAIAVLEPLWADKGEAGRIVDFRVLNANLALERITGQPKSHLIGQSITQIFPYANAAMLMLHCTEGIEEGSTSDFPMSVNQQPYQISVTAKIDQLVLAFSVVS